MKDHLPEDFYDVIIIGAGFAGLCAAIRLQEEDKNNFIILERAGALGGTWRDNTYPGCGCDIPSRLYSLAAEPNPDWSRAFSRQPEILAYMEKFAKKRALHQKIHFNTAANAMYFDAEKGIWHLNTDCGKNYTCRFVISATGPLNRAIIPAFKGLDSFTGEYFHSSNWPEDYSLKNRSVAIIGTGASAVQIVPAIVDEVAKLSLFQRTPAWIMPKRDKEVSALRKKIYRQFPLLEKLARMRTFYFYELQGKGFWGNMFINNTAQALGRRYLRKSVADPELRKKLTPNYALGCKRVTPSDDYYPALQQEHVSLVTTTIEAIQPDGILTVDGALHKADTIVFATGFRAAEDLVDYPVEGLNGLSLREEWERTGMEALHGITVSGFPNFLLLLGPNTGLGHNSVLLIMEAQMNYIMDYMKKLDASGARYFDVRREVQEAYNRKIQEELKTTIWASGCSSWYQDKNGKNTTLWPGSVMRYQKATKGIELSEYEKAG